MKHENKFCPRCKAGFECKVGSVSNCQCSAVALNEAERNYMGDAYTDCLCAACMKEVRSEYHQRKFKNTLKRLLRLR